MYEGQILKCIEFIYNNIMLDHNASRFYYMSVILSYFIKLYVLIKPSQFKMAAVSKMLVRIFIFIEVIIEVSILLFDVWAKKKI